MKDEIAKTEESQNDVFERGALRTSRGTYLMLNFLWRLVEDGGIDLQRYVNEQTDFPDE